jgi:hypothetical protein
MSEKRLNELLGEFGPRLKTATFTVEGMPSEEEVHLTKEIWGYLKENERRKILENTARMAAEEMGVEVGEIPDQTPYAMRLTYLHLQIKASS